MPRHLASCLRHVGEVWCAADCPLARQTATARFLATFAKVKHEKVGAVVCGKTMPADRITWAGVWGGRRVVLRSRPRNINAIQTFMISSNQRLRTSGHDDALFVDVELLEGALDAGELEDLQALIQMCESRPVRLRRRGERVR